MVSGRAKTAKGQKGVTVSLYALFLSLLTAPGCSSPASPAADVRSTPVTLTIGLPVQTGQDPLHGASQAARLLSFEGLTYLARDGRPRPKLAESLTESPDGLTWTVQLRRNAFFHDGSPANAAAIKQSLEASVKGADRDRSPGLSDIVAIEAPSEYTLLIRLRARSRFLLDDLTVAIVKREEGGETGTGPFTMGSTVNDELVMSVDPNYYRGKPTIDRVVWKSYPGVRTAWAAMMRGEIDFLYQVPPEAVEFIEAEDSVKLFSFLRNYAYLVVFNSKRKPFDDWQVRRALNYAVNRERLITRVFNNRGQIASGPLWPLHWAYDSTVLSYSYDPGRAIALLNAAQVPQERRNASTDSAPGRFHFTCLIPDNFALWERMALIVQRDLAEIGVDMKIESVPFKVFNQRIAAGDFDAVTMELIVGNTASRPFTFWSSTSTENSWGYRNPTLDQALDDLRRAPDETQYKSAFRRVQEQGLNNPPAIFLALGQVTRAVSDRFEVVAPPNTDILPSISDWRETEPASRAPN